MQTQMLRKRIRYLLVFFFVSLVVSGLTALPLKLESDLLQMTAGAGTLIGRLWPALAHWVALVQRGIAEMKREQPFIFYGTDWLAFGHIVIAVFFIGPLRDPVRNVWVIEAGMIACILVLPMALIFGPVRGIPFFWRLADCSFGVFGIIPLWLARNYVRRVVALERPGAG